MALTAGIGKVFGTVVRVARQIQIQKQGSSMAYCHTHSLLSSEVSAARAGASPMHEF